VLPLDYRKIYYLINEIYSRPFNPQYDEFSVGPPPPCSILITGLSPLTPYPHVRRHFSSHAPITAFDPKADPSTGAPLGIVFITFASHDIARMVASKENGRRIGVGTEGLVVSVELDAGPKCKEKVAAEIARRRKKIEDAKKAAANPGTPLSNGTSQPTPAPLPPSSNPNLPSFLPPKPPPPISNQPPTPIYMGSTARKAGGRSANSNASVLLGSRMSASTPPPPPVAVPPVRMRTPSPPPPPPPQPIEPPPPLPKPQSEADKEAEHEALILVLQKNAKEHVRIDGLPIGRGVLDRSGMIGLKEEDVMAFFDGFDPEKVGISSLSGSSRAHEFWNVFTGCP
jgi:RNA recognition motif-containing protein